MTGATPIIEVRDIVKRFGDDVVAVDGVNLEIVEGEFFALLGPSGCGKTTLLRMIAGFEVPSEGSIAIAGVDMAGAPPNRRPVNMVFQSYAVFPHMTVEENLGYGLKVSGVGKRERRERVAEALSLVRLEGLGDRKPDQLSGGQRQRVALARALVKRPKVLLLDEPLSALDAKLREAMQVELVGLQKTVGITFVIVTHDQDEALSMADRIGVMSNGKVIQVAPPPVIYEFPASRFVAGFMGRMNLFEAVAEGRGYAGLAVRVEGLGGFAVPYDHDLSGPVSLAVRPEKTRLSPEPPVEGLISIQAVVTQVAYHGNESRVFLKADNGLLLASVVRNDMRTPDSFCRIGDRLWVWWAPEDTIVLTR